MARFAATQKAIDAGLDTLKPDQGVKVIDDWIAQLEGSDKRGAKGVSGDLAKLKTELKRSEPRADKVLNLVHKLGAATAKLADAAEGANAEKLRALGEALSSAGHAGTEDEEE